MSEATTEAIVEKNNFPLRIMGKKGEKYLACPFELTYDDVILNFYKNDPAVAHLEVVSSPIATTGDPGGFKRHFLYSRSDQKHIVTASGYLFEGPVDVPNVKNVEMLHVLGDKQNKTGGLRRAVRKHYERIADIETYHLSLQEVMDFFDKMKNNVPRV